MKLRNIKEVSCILGSTLVISVLLLGGCGKHEESEQKVTKEETTVVDKAGWKNSPGHYANMIKADFGKLGVGYSEAGNGNYNYYWVQMFTD